MKPLYICVKIQDPPNAHTLFYQPFNNHIIHSRKWELTKTEKNLKKIIKFKNLV
jgi:hypothetical protein